MAEKSKDLVSLLPIFVLESNIALTHKPEKAMEIIVDTCNIAVLFAHRTVYNEFLIRISYKYKQNIALCQSSQGQKKR